MDLLLIIRREYKSCSHSLNNVSFHFLKQDVHYSIVCGDNTRRCLSLYCLKDSLLSVKLIDVLMIATNPIGMTRVADVPISFFIQFGHLYSKATRQDLLILYRKG